MTFNPQEHLTQVKGKDYLEVKWRLVWFREEHPDWTIDTEFLILDMDQGVAVCQATISDENNRQLAKGTKTEYKASFFDFVEKAETGAIGRALAALGYGTQFAPELEEGERIVDSPVEKPNNNSKKGDNKQDKSRVIKDINMMLEILDWDNKDAQEILKDTTGKKSMRDCNIGELKKYRNELHDCFICLKCKGKVTLGEIRYCYGNDMEIRCQDCQ